MSDETRNTMPSAEALRALLGSRAAVDLTALAAHLAGVRADLAFTAATAMRAIQAAALREQARPLVTNPATGNTYQVRRLAMSDLILAGALPEEYTQLLDQVDELQRRVRAERGDVKPTADTP
jgi:hypothetical protein